MVVDQSACAKKSSVRAFNHDAPWEKKNFISLRSREAKAGDVIAKPSKKELPTRISYTFVFGEPGPEHF